MMKTKKLISIILVAVLACSVLSACSKDEPTSEPQTTEITTEKTTTPAVTQQAEEKTTFELTDSNGNVFTAVPVYNSDGKTLIAAYIESAKDKDGKALDEKSCTYIKKVIAVEVDSEGKKQIKLDADKKIVTLNALADNNGYIIAIQDTIDIDNDKDTEEYFKATTTITDNGNITIALDKDSNGKLINVTVKTETKDGNKVTTVTTDDGKKHTVTESTKAPNLDDVAKDNNNSNQNSASNTDNNKPDNNNNNSGNNSDTEEEGNSIVLMKNGKGRTNSSGVAFSIADNQGVCKITKGGDYVITTETDLWHGQIIVELPNTEEADLRFEDVNISSTTANVIRILDSSIDNERTFFETEATVGTSADNELSDTMKKLSKETSAPDVALSFPTGTSSSFSTGANSYSGVIYNESKLTVKGNGNVSISSIKNRNNAICSTKSVTFKNVSAYLETPNYTSTSSLSSARGIFTYSKVTVESGKLTIRTNGDCIRCDDLYVEGGTVDLWSGSADGVDSDDRIVILGGNVKSIALEKSSFKVRRVNNQDDISNGDTSIKAENGITKLDQTFRIDGGTVRGEGKNCTKTSYIVIPASVGTPQQLHLSKQVCILCTSAKTSGDDGVKSRTPIIFKLSGSGLNVTSENKCGRFLYSSPDLSKDDTYQVSAEGRTTVTIDSSKYIGNSVNVKVKAIK